MRITTSLKIGYLLDVDTLERFFRSDAAILNRLDKTLRELVWVSSITAEEMLSGALSEINKARERGGYRDIEAPSRYFSRLIERLRIFNILPCTNAAEELYAFYPAAIKRIGKMDCRLAAHAPVSTTSSSLPATPPISAAFLMSKSWIGANPKISLLRLIAQSC